MENVLKMYHRNPDCYHFIIIYITVNTSALFYYNFGIPDPNPKYKQMKKQLFFKRNILHCLCLVFLLLTGINMQARNPLEKDVINTTGGPAEITFIGHGSLMIVYQGKVVHVDPFSELTDYSVLPKADLILITHEHGDHLDLKAIQAIKKDNTQIYYTEKCASTLSGGTVMHNGDSQLYGPFRIEAVPAYNLVNGPQAGMVYHKKGDGNGYILTLGDKQVYIAGDTENTPEMKALKNIDIAFLPMNLPYTMTPEMVADAVKAFKPKILYPYHYGETNTQKLLDLLKDQKDTEIRIRKMK
jgi:L-ascorbate metabolism protein UlaG (beta-lactamase superfamily)